MIWLLLLQVQVDWAVHGEGLLRLLDDERPVYVSKVRLVAREGEPLRLAMGPRLDPPVILPPRTRELRLRDDGIIVALVDAVDGSRHAALQAKEIGCLSLAKFLPGRETPILGRPGDPGFGRVVQGPDNVRVATPPQVTVGGTQDGSKNSSTESLSIVGRHFAETIGERVLLGEIAELSGHPEKVEQATNLAVGAAPLPGGSRVLTRGEVLAKLRAAGLLTESVRIELPESVRVSRQSQEVPSSAIVDAAKAALPTEAEPDLLTPLVSARKVTAPRGDYSLVAGAPTRSGLGWSVPVAVHVNGKTTTTVHVRFQPHRPAQQKAEHVRVGTQVTVILHSAGVQVETNGVLRTAGPVGASVTVYIPTTKRTVSGKLNDPNTVKVTL